MQSPNFPITNPLKPKQDNVNPKLTVQKKPKLDRRVILISILVILGLLSLLITAFVNKKSTNPSKYPNATPTLSQPQDSLQPQPGNKWQQQLNSINDQLNQNLDLDLPKINQEITF